MKSDIIRKCIVTGETQEKTNLLRFVVVESVGVVPDFKKKLGGKGVYVRNSKKILEKAIEQNLFAKSLRKKINVDKTLVKIVENCMKTSALQSISMARKAGKLIWGLDKVLEAIKQNKVAFLLEANNVGSDGHKKITSHAKEIEIYSLFNSEELDKELNRENTVYLAVVKGNIANMVKDSLIRLTAFLNN